MEDSCPNQMSVIDGARAKLKCLGTGIWLVTIPGVRGALMHDTKPRRTVRTDLSNNL